MFESPAWVTEMAHLVFTTKTWAGPQEPEQ